jgi:hypothetical protein
MNGRGGIDVTFQIKMKSHLPATTVFRLKLLTAAVWMQATIGVASAAFQTPVPRSPPNHPEQHTQELLAGVFGRLLGVCLSSALIQPSLVVGWSRTNALDPVDECGGRTNRLVG